MASPRKIGKRLLLFYFIRATIWRAPESPASCKSTAADVLSVQLQKVSEMVWCEEGDTGIWGRWCAGSWLVLGVGFKETLRLILPILAASAPGVCGASLQLAEVGEAWSAWKWPGQPCAVQKRTSQPCQPLPYKGRPKTFWGSQY